MRFYGLAVALICGACISAAAPGARQSKEFDLEIKLKDPYNPELSVMTLVRLDEPFVVRVGVGKVTNVFWGELHPPKDGVYRLELSICEWESATSNLTGTTAYDLKLGEGQAGGFVSGFVYSREVVVREHVADKRGD
jgi:hypothetical protein